MVKYGTLANYYRRVLTKRCRAVVKFSNCLPGLQDDVGVGGARRHRIRREVRRAAARKHEGDLREFLDHVFVDELHRLRLRQRRARRFTSMTMFFSSSFGMNS